MEATEQKRRRRSIRNLRRSSITFGIQSRLNDEELNFGEEAAKEPLSTLDRAYGSAWVDERDLEHYNVPAVCQQDSPEENHQVCEQQNSVCEDSVSDSTDRPVNGEFSDYNPVIKQIHNSAGKPWSSIDSIVENDGHHQKNHELVSPEASQVNEKHNKSSSTGTCRTLDLEEDCTDSQSLSGRKSDHAEHGEDSFMNDLDIAGDQLNQALISTPYLSPPNLANLTHVLSDHCQNTDIVLPHVSGKVPSNLATSGKEQMYAISYASDQFCPTPARAMSSTKSLKLTQKHLAPLLRQTPPRSTEINKPTVRKEQVTQKHSTADNKVATPSSYKETKSAKKLAPSTHKHEHTKIPRQATPTPKKSVSSPQKSAASTKSRTEHLPSTKKHHAGLHLKHSSPDLTSPRTNYRVSPISTSSNQHLVVKFKKLGDKLQELTDSTKKVKGGASDETDTGKEVSQKSELGKLKKNRYSTGVVTEHSKNIGGSISSMAKSPKPTGAKKRLSLVQNHGSHGKETQALSGSVKEKPATGTVRKKLTLPSKAACSKQTVGTQKSSAHSQNADSRRKTTTESHSSQPDNMDDVIHRLSCKLQALQTQVTANSQTGAMSDVTGDMEACPDHTHNNKAGNLEPSRVKPCNIKETTPQSLVISDKDQTFHSTSNFQAHWINSDTYTAPFESASSSQHEERDIDAETKESYNTDMGMHYHGFEDCKRNSTTDSQTETCSVPKKRKRLSIKKSPPEKSDNEEKIHSRNKVTEEILKSSANMYAGCESIMLESNTLNQSDKVNGEECGEEIHILSPDEWHNNTCTIDPVTSEVSDEMIQELLRSDYLDLRFGTENKTEENRVKKSQRRSSRYFSLLEMPLYEGRSSIENVSPSASETPARRTDTTEYDEESENKENTKTDMLQDTDDFMRKSIDQGDKSVLCDSATSDNIVMERVIGDLVNLHVSDNDTTETGMNMTKLKHSKKRGGKQRLSSKSMHTSHTSHIEELCSKNDKSSSNSGSHMTSNCWKKSGSKAGKKTATCLNVEMDMTSEFSENKCDRQNLRECLVGEDVDGCRQAKCRKTEAVDVVEMDESDHRSTNGNNLDVSATHDTLTEPDMTCADNVVSEDDTEVVGQRSLRVRKNRKSWDLACNTGVSDEENKSEKKTKRKSVGKKAGGSTAMSCDDSQSLTEDGEISEGLENLYRNKNYVLPSLRTWETIKENPISSQTVFTKQRYKRFLHFDSKVTQARLQRRHKKAMEVSRAGLCKRTTISDAEFEQKMLDVQLFLDSPSTFMSG